MSCTCEAPPGMAHSSDCDLIVRAIKKARCTCLAGPGMTHSIECPLGYKPPSTITAAYDYVCPKCGAPSGSSCVGYEQSPRVHIERAAKHRVSFQVPRADLTTQRLPSTMDILAAAGMTPRVVDYRYRVGANTLSALGPPHAILDNKEQEAIALCWSPEKAKLIVDALNYPPLPRIPEL